MTAQNILTYGNEQIPYQVNPDPRRTTRIAIHVEPDGSVIVDAPPDQPDEMVHKAVHKRARWIADHVAEAKDRYRHVHPKSYVSGEQVLYLGRRYMLKVVQSDTTKGTARLHGNRLEVTVQSKDPRKVRGIVRAWYRTRARDYFARLIDQKSKKLSWIDQPPPFRLLEMSRQWGSCSPQGQVILNPHLVKAPRECIEYVVVHELAHLKHHDHSPEFFDLVSLNAPGWEKQKRLLDRIVEVLTND
ncbi:M48 family metallopeptidase [uncultured Ruegeria sp.]|uniref:M48 family metallopeptidase n=1 Tax=uncultured Ruegeria sp. TaxID=259304 RepID=UPI0026260FF0|nr:SprT family zinc-dependent metalloprotease [uncultured Ruegeria sp.]